MTLLCVVSVENCISMCNYNWKTVRTSAFRKDIRRFCIFWDKKRHTPFDATTVLYADDCEISQSWRNVIKGHITSWRYDTPKACLEKDTAKEYNTVSFWIWDCCKIYAAEECHGKPQRRHALNSFFGIDGGEGWYLSCWRRYHIAGGKCIFHSEICLLGAITCIFQSPSDILFLYFRHQFDDKRCHISMCMHTIEDVSMRKTICCTRKTIWCTHKTIWCMRKTICCTHELWCYTHRIGTYTHRIFSEWYLREPPEPHLMNKFTADKHHNCHRFARNVASMQPLKGMWFYSDIFRKNDDCVYQNE